MSVNPITIVANHLLLSAEGGSISITELIAPLEGTLVEIEQLIGTLRCLDE